MKKNIITRILSLALALVLLAGFALAEEHLPEGDLPKCGVILPYTQADLDMNIYLESTPVDVYESIPAQLFTLSLVAPAALEAEAELMAAYQAGDMEAYYAAYEEYISHTYALSIVLVIRAEDFSDEMLNGFTKLDENNGLVYLLMELNEHQTIQEEDRELYETALARSGEIIANMAYRDVEPWDTNSFPAFSSVDLSGETVTSEIFAGKDITVVNVWGTYCGPCISEMPELAAWHAEMPENVQIIGVVSDLNSFNDTATLETAVALCEATGVTYTNIVANEDFYALLQQGVGVPTTYFVDGEGNIIGDPVVGAYVDGYKTAVEEYLAGK